MLPNKWYTLSFYLKGTGELRSRVLSNAINRDQQVIVDGLLKTITSTNGTWKWNLTDTWTRHTFSFKTLSTLPESISVAFRVYGASTPSNILICKPQLELGNKVSDWKQAEEDVELKVDTVVTKQNDLQRTLDSTVSTISSHTSSIDGLETKYSQIKQTADSVQTTVSNMKISSRNLLKNTDFKQGKSYWNSDIDIKTAKIIIGNC